MPDRPEHDREHDDERDEFLSTVRTMVDTWTAVAMHDGETVAVDVSYSDGYLALHVGTTAAGRARVDAVRPAVRPAEPYADDPHPALAGVPVGMPPALLDALRDRLVGLSTPPPLGGLRLADLFGSGVPGIMVDLDEIAPPVPPSLLDLVRMVKGHSLLGGNADPARFRADADAFNERMDRVARLWVIDGVARRKITPTPPEPWIESRLASGEVGPCEIIREWCALDEPTRYALAETHRADSNGHGS